MLLNVPWLVAIFCRYFRFHVRFSCSSCSSFLLPVFSVVSHVACVSLFPAVFVERVFLTRLYIYRTRSQKKKEKSAKDTRDSHGTACGGGGGGVFETETSPER